MPYCLGGSATLTPDVLPVVIICCPCSAPIPVKLVFMVKKWLAGGLAYAVPETC